MLEDVMGMFIPITAIFMGILCGILAIYFQTRRQREEQEALRIALEKGVEQAVWGGIALAAGIGQLIFYALTAKSAPEEPRAHS